MDYEALTKGFNELLEDSGYQAARKYVNDYINANPNRSEGYLLQGELFELNNDFSSAIHCFDKALQFSPKNAEIFCSRGTTYAKYGDNLQEALADFNEAISIDPRFSRAYCNRGNIYLKLRQPQKAIDDCSKAIELSPNEIEQYYNRGLAYFNTKEFHKALADFDRIIELDPNNSEAYAKRGCCHVEIGHNLDKAIHDFERFLELDPDNEFAPQVRDALLEIRSSGKTVRKTIIISVILAIAGFGVVVTNGGIGLALLSGMLMFCSPLGFKFLTERANDSALVATANELVNRTEGGSGWRMLRFIIKLAVSIFIGPIPFVFFLIKKRSNS